MGRLGQLVLISFGGKGPVRLRDDFYFFTFFIFAVKSACQRVLVAVRLQRKPLVMMGPGDGRGGCRRLSVKVYAANHTVFHLFLRRSARIRTFGGTPDTLEPLGGR